MSGLYIYIYLVLVIVVGAIFDLLDRIYIFK